MKKAILYIILAISFLGYSQGGSRPARFKSGFYIVPKSNFPNNPKQGQFFYDAPSNKPYYYDGSGWLSFGNDQISLTENIASTDLSGIGSIKAQVAAYINALNYDKTSDTSDLWFKVENAFILDKETTGASTPYQIGGMSMSSDGAIMYASNHNHYGRKYDLSTPYDVSTAVEGAASTVIGLGQGGGFHITSDGSHLVYSNGDLNNGPVEIYNMSTPHDFGTLSLLSTDNLGFNIGDFDLYLTDDGTQFYVMDSGSIKQYTLTTPYDVTTRTLTNELLMDNTKYTFAFSYDRSRIFVISVGGILEQYNLSTAGDLSTATKLNKQVDFTEIIGSGNFIKMAISTDGSKMIITRYVNNTTTDWAFKTLYFTTNNTIGDVVKSQSDFSPPSEYYRLKNRGRGIISGVTANDLDDIGGTIKFSEILDDRTFDATAKRTSFEPYLTLDTENVQDVIEELKDEMDAIVASSGGETAGTIKTKYESNPDTNVFTDAEKTKLAAQSGSNTGDQDISGISTNANAISSLQSEQTTQDAAIALNTAKNSYPTSDANKLSNIEANAKDDLTATEIEALFDAYYGNSDWRTGGETAGSIKTKYESNPDTNVFTDAEKTKLAAQSGSNTGDQDISGISTNANAISSLQSEQTTQDAAIALNTAKNSYPTSDANKLSSIEANAKDDLTDAEIVALLDAHFGNTDWRTNSGSGTLQQILDNNNVSTTGLRVNNDSNSSIYTRLGYNATKSFLELGSSFNGVINEIGFLQASNLTATRTWSLPDATGILTTTSISDAAYLKQNDNLSDLSSNSAARTNLDVYSKAETDTAIANAVGSNEIPHNEETSAYTLALDDSATVIVNNNQGDILYEIPDNATLDYPAGTALLFHAVEITDTTRVSFLNRGNRLYVKTKQDADGEEQFAVVQRSDDNWYAKGAYEYYTPAVVSSNVYTETNALSATNNADSTTGVVYNFNNSVGTATVSSVANGTRFKIQSLTDVAGNVNVDFEFPVENGKVYDMQITVLEFVADSGVTSTYIGDLGGLVNVTIDSDITFTDTATVEDRVLTATATGTARITVKQFASEQNDGFEIYDLTITERP